MPSSADSRPAGENPPGDGPQPGETPPEAFIQGVKDALEHLYDLPYLQSHPVQCSPEQALGGKALRQELASAIEALSPGSHVPFGSPPARLYNLLRSHYVEMMTIRNTAVELGLSERQAHRDLRRGIESVAGILWGRLAAASPAALPAGPAAAVTPPAGGAAPSEAQLSSFQAEMERLGSAAHPTDVRGLVQRGLAAVERQAQQKGVALRASLPAQAVILSVDATVAEQVFANTFSRAVQQSERGELSLELKGGAQTASLLLRYLPTPEAQEAAVANLMLTQLADHLGWSIRQSDLLDGARQVAMQLHGHGPTVLVVDDNEGLVQLLERYLTDQACRVMVATNGQDGLRLAQESMPAAIILDVMMPKMSGWEFLQRLRANPQTSETPVIICSVINNPELAYSLGGNLFLPKPVSREDVLHALRTVGVV